MTTLQSNEALREEFDTVCNLVLLSGGRKIEMWNFILSHRTADRQALIEEIRQLIEKDDKKLNFGWTMDQCEYGCKDRVLDLLSSLESNT